MRSMVLTLPLFTLMAATASAAGTPGNTINCVQFAKVGPITWNEQGMAVFDFGKVKGIHLEKTPIQPRAFMFEGSDLYQAIDLKCGTK